MIRKFREYIPKIDTTCFIASDSDIIGNVEIGKNSSVWYKAVLRGDMAKIAVGENSNIQDGCVLHCMTDIEIKIGNNVTVGHNAVLHSCTIDDGSLIGMGSIVLDGARIGKNCLVGAGTLVTPNTVVPDGSMVLGSPGKVKRQLSNDEITYLKRASVEYTKLAEESKIEDK